MSDTPPVTRLDIDTILARVRAELVDEAMPEASILPERRFRRSSTADVPLVEEDDVSAASSRDWSVDDFEELDEATFLHTAYRVILGREVDGSGLAHFLPALRDGNFTVIGVLGSLRFSVEGRSMGRHIGGLSRRAYFFDRAARMPYVGRVTGPFVHMAMRSRTLRRLQRRIASSDLRHRELIQAINESLMGVRRGFTHVDKGFEHVDKGFAQAEKETSRVESETAKALAFAKVATEGLEKAQIELASARRLIAQETRQLSNLIDNAATDLGSQTPQALTLQNLDEHLHDALYVAFENRFRGSAAEIGARQSRYLDMFRSAEPIVADGLVLDIGCGRGEWLTLLRSENISARGIDLNAAMIEYARAQGLDVVEGDAISYLRTLREGSLAAVTGFHIVEHLAFRDLVALLDEACRALVPGGIILFETPNPENLVVGACTFNYDPSHNKPLPPDLMRFLAEMRGYDDIRILRTETDCQLEQAESKFSPTEINDWFRAPPDYALFGRKVNAQAGDDGAG